jgi:hypothetical protein
VEFQVEPKGVCGVKLVAGLVNDVLKNQYVCRRGSAGGQGCDGWFNYETQFCDVIVVHPLRADAVQVICLGR